MTNPPKSFSDAAALVGSAELPVMLKQKLIQLAFMDKNETVAFRAIELLLAMPRQEEVDEFNGLSDSDLIKKLHEQIVGEEIDF